MLKMLRNGKGVKIILVVSLVGIGSVSYIPTTYAAMNETAVTAPAVEQNTLSKLEIDGGSFDQVFSPDVYEYTATVENSVQQTTLNVESENPQAVITINGQTVTNGTAGSLPLKTGENLFTITVDDSSHTASTYKVTVTRKQNSNNSIKNIKLSKGELSPAFYPAIVNYNLSLPNETNAITLTPEAFEETSGIIINNQKFKDKGITVSLPVGKSIITILVTAENGEKKTYTLHVTRAAKQTNNPPVSQGKTGTGTGTNGTHNPYQSKQPASRSKSTSNSNQTNKIGQNGNSAWTTGAAKQTGAVVQKINKPTLSTLTVSNGTWNKDFTTSAYTYHLAESNEVKTVTITPSATYSSSTIKIDGNTSSKVQLDGNKTTISVVVTNGDDRKTYVLVFEKKQQKSVVKAEAIGSTDTTVSSNTDTTSVNQDTIGQKTAWNGRNNTVSTSFWGRIVNSVSSFFKNIF